MNFSSELAKYGFFHFAYMLGAIPAILFLLLLFLFVDLAQVNNLVSKARELIHATRRSNELVQLLSFLFLAFLTEFHTRNLNNCVAQDAREMHGRRTHFLPAAKSSWRHYFLDHQSLHKFLMFRESIDVDRNSIFGCSGMAPRIARIAETLVHKRPIESPPSLFCSVF